MVWTSLLPIFLSNSFFHGNTFLLGLSRKKIVNYCVAAFTNTTSVEFHFRSNFVTSLEIILCKKISSPSPSTTLYNPDCLFQMNNLLKIVLFSISRTTALFKRALFYIFIENHSSQNSTPQKSNIFAKNSTNQKITPYPCIPGQK